MKAISIFDKVIFFMYSIFGDVFISGEYLLLLVSLFYLLFWRFF